MTDRPSVPALASDHVGIREAAPGELHHLAGVMASDPEVNVWWSTDADTIRRWFDDPEYAVLVVEERGRTAGIIAFEEQTDPDYHSVGVDISLFSGFVGRGLGPEALTLLVRWLIDERGHHRITIDPAVANARAVRAYEKTGFRRVGVAREYERGPDGSWHDNLIMDLLARDVPPATAGRREHEAGK
jgi:aminoglycoside 6'-N-acetyltransferase